MIVLIPAFQPDGALVDLVRRLRAATPHTVLVVDDGSGPAYREVFAQAENRGAVVIGYPRNRGKGHALKTGFSESMRRWPGGDVVCADADGQHTVADIVAVADRVAGRGAGDADGRVTGGEVAGAAGGGGTSPVTGHAAGHGAAAGAADHGGVGAVADRGSANVAVARARTSAAERTIVLGQRALRDGVPVRSRIGNSATRLLFRLVTGLRVHDTQTGLRGYPAALLPQLVRVPGARYEYELNVLLRAHQAGWRLTSVPISTVYVEGNASSHFRPLADSARVYAPLLAFCASSLTAFAVDAAGVLYLYAATGSLITAVVGARAVSATVNYVVNRRLVFRTGRDRPVRSTALRYAALLAAVVVANWAALALLTGLGLALLPAKVVTDMSLFVVSYSAQHRMVFAGGPERLSGAGTEPARRASYASVLDPVGARLSGPPDGTHPPARPRPGD